MGGIEGGRGDALLWACIDDNAGARDESHRGSDKHTVSFTTTKSMHFAEPQTNYRCG